MVTGFILLKVENGKSHEIAKNLIGRFGIIEVHSVSNGVDLVAIMKLADKQTLKTAISEQLAAIKEITILHILISSHMYAGYNVEDDIEFKFSL